MNKFLEVKRDELAKEWIEHNPDLTCEEEWSGGFTACHELYAPLVEEVKRVIKFESCFGSASLKEALRAVGEI